MSKNNNFNKNKQIILILIGMYNSFMAEKLQDEYRQLQRNRNKVKKWQHRYKTQVMPNLITKFNRRMNGFIRKMEDEPVALPQQPTEARDKLLMRKFDDKLNICEDRFRFKNSSDWNSLCTPIEAAGRTRILKSCDKNNMDSALAFRSIFAKSKYEPLKHDYRSRTKEKQINPAMRYATKNTSATIQVLPKIRKSQTKLNKSLDGRKYGNPENNFYEKQQQEGLTTSNQNSTIDLFSSNVIKPGVKYQRTREKSEAELIDQQQLKLLAQDKLYFKSLQNLEMKMKQNGEKEALKALLQKCGVKKVTQSHLKKAEADNFFQLISNISF